MLKLLKYEIASITKTILTTLILVIALNVLTFIGYHFVARDFLWQTGVTDSNWFISAFKGIVGLGIMLCILVDLGIFLLSFVFGINILRKDLYSDTGMLLMTLPKKGTHIIIAKLLASILQFIVLFITSISFMALHVMALSEAVLNKTNSLLNMISGSALGNIRELAYLSIICIWAFACIMIVTYLAIVFSKSFFRIKKLKWVITAAVSIGIFIVYGVVANYIETLIPYTFDLSKIIVGSKSSLMMDINFNYVGTIFEILTFSGMIFGTAYLYEKKVEV